MQARLGDWLSFGYRPLGNSSLSEGTISSGGDGNEHRAIAAKPRDAEVQRLPLRKEQSMTAESAGCRPFAKIPVPIQDTYSVAEIAILLRVSRNAVYEWSLLEDDPLPLRRMMGRKRGRFAFRDELLEWSKRHAT